MNERANELVKLLAAECESMQDIHMLSVAKTEVLSLKWLSLTAGTVH